MIQDILDSASRNLMSSDPATVEEAFSSSFNLSQETATSVAEFNQLREQYARDVDAIEAATGHRLPNPTDQVGVALEAFPGRNKTLPQAEAEFEAETRKLRETDDRVPVRTAAEVRQAIGVSRELTRQEAARVQQRTVGTFPEIAGFAGQAAGVMADPVTLSTMAFGAPWAAGIVRGALIDAALSAGSEAVIQLAVQGQRADIGEQPDIRIAGENVGLAGVGGLFLSGALRGVARGGSEVLERIRARSTEVDDAARFLEREAELRGTSPLPDTPIGRAAHERRLDAAMERLRYDSEPGVAVTSPEAVRAGGDLRESFPSEATRSLPPLTEAESQVVETLGRMVDEPARFGAFLDTLRFPPKVEGLTLLQYIRAKGGLRPDPELESMGITPRQFPALINRRGLTLDTAGELSHEAGYFPDHVERPMVNDVLEQLDEEVNRGRPMRTLEGSQQVEARRSAEEYGRALESLGIDVKRQKTPEVIARVRDLVAQAEQPSSMRAPSARAESARVEAATENAETLDQIREREVRETYRGREGEPVLIETEDGAFKQMTWGDLDKLNEREAADLDALKTCIGGGNAKS